MSPNINSQTQRAFPEALLILTVISVVCWAASNRPKRAKSLGLMGAPQRGPPSGTIPNCRGYSCVFNNQRGLSETLGDLRFKFADISIVIALVHRFPCKIFATTHTFLADTYLAHVAHAVVLLDLIAWAARSRVISK